MSIGGSGYNTGGSRPSSPAPAGQASQHQIGRTCLKYKHDRTGCNETFVLGKDDDSRQQHQKECEQYRGNGNSTLYFCLKDENCTYATINSRDTKKHVEKGSCEKHIDNVLPPSNRQETCQECGHSAKVGKLKPHFSTQNGCKKYRQLMKRSIEVARLKGLEELAEQLRERYEKYNQQSGNPSGSMQAPQYPIDPSRAMQAQELPPIREIPGVNDALLMHGPTLPPFVPGTQRQEQLPSFNDVVGNQN